MDVSEADYSELTPDRIISSVESLGLLSDGRILALNSYENRVYQVGIEDAEPVIAKFYRPGRWTDEQILEEHQFCFDLADEDLPVVPPICFNSQSLHQFEGYRFSLFPRRGGRESDMDNPDNLAQLGRYLGRMHVVGAAKDFSFRPRIDLQTYGVESADFLTRHFIPDALTGVYESLSRDILLLIEQRMGEAGKIGFIRCHGDCHAGNILWRLVEPNFVDFDDARMAPGVQDLWMLLSGSREEQEAQLGIVIDAYEQFIEFDDRQLQLVEPLRTLRMMHYAAWLARRWDDPAFPVTFPWFNTERYWGQHILELREQMAALQEPPLRIG